jgi:hypothetical protein
MVTNERTPLLRDPEHSAANFWDFGDHRNDDLHTQFCKLVGIPPSERIVKDSDQAIPRNSLYGRATRLKKSQQSTYLFTAALSNTLLLSQVVLGAALTALGASESSHVLITLFGAANTIIAGVVAYLKSRGQPMRARMFRDDLERIVDEIENSEIMWRGMMTCFCPIETTVVTGLNAKIRKFGAGISMGIHGYDEIDVDDQVTIRSEIARLTRLYEKIVRTNTMNSPDTYQDNQLSSKQNTTLRSRPTLGLSQLGPFAQPPQIKLLPDPDQSPAIAPPLAPGLGASQPPPPTLGTPGTPGPSQTNVAPVSQGETKIAQPDLVEVAPVDLIDPEDPSPVTDLRQAPHDHHREKDTEMDMEKEKDKGKGITQG